MTSSDVLELTHQKPGQDVFLEYRRHAKSSWSGSARHPKACYFFAIFLLSFCYFTDLPGRRLLFF
ncbi:hypothetical protein ACNY6I_004329, partial [Cronobacter sakazakii]